MITEGTRGAGLWAVALAAALGAWQVAALAGVLPREAVPSPAAVMMDLWSNRAAYGSSLAATASAASLGYLLGNAVAVLAGVLFVWRPGVEVLARGLNLITFAMPPIALGPLLAIAFSGALPQVILAAMSVYFTTMTVTTVGLRQVDADAMALVRLYGGGDLAGFRWVRLRSALPTIMSGLRAGASASLLGAMLAEFGSGAPGLGSFLLASMSLGQPDRVWGIAIVATAVSVLAFAVLSWITSRFSWRPISTLEPVAQPPYLQQPARTGWARAFAIGGAMAAVLIPFVLWQALPALLGLSPAVVQTPLELWSYLVTSPDAAMTWTSILTAAKQTLPLAAGGMLLGAAAAVFLALTSRFLPWVGRTLTFPVLLLQSTPLVALIPLIILLLGRGLSATLAISTSVCFYPAFVTLSQALDTVPPNAVSLLRLYGASPFKILRFVTLPYLTPYLFTAARLVAPTALLGVMTAEWLATGYGFGGLMNEARGNLDYGMIWTVAFITVGVAIVLYQGILALERALLRRRYL